MFVVCFAPALTAQLLSASVSTGVDRTDVCHTRVWEDRGRNSHLEKTPRGTGANARHIEVSWW